MRPRVPFPPTQTRRQGCGQPKQRAAIMRPSSGWRDAPRTSSKSGCCSWRTWHRINLFICDGRCHQSNCHYEYAELFFGSRNNRWEKLLYVWTFHPHPPSPLLSTLFFLLLFFFVSLLLCFSSFMCIWRWVMDELCSHKNTSTQTSVVDGHDQAAGQRAPGAPGGPPLLHPWVRYLSWIASVNIQLCKWMKANVK